MYIHKLHFISEYMDTRHSLELYNQYPHIHMAVIAQVVYYSWQLNATFVPVKLKTE
jgi:hypothetical protein